MIITVHYTANEKKYHETHVIPDRPEIDLQLTGPDAIDAFGRHVAASTKDSAIAMTIEEGPGLGPNEVIGLENFTWAEMAAFDVELKKLHDRSVAAMKSIIQEKPETWRDREPLL